MARSVLFVCYGNICRSTMAEAILSQFLSKQNLREKWVVDSAAHGTLHLGEPPAERTQQVLSQHGITDYRHTARMITEEDFTTFEYILCMDDYNLRYLIHHKPTRCKSVIKRLGDFDPKGIKIIYDPYFSDSLETYEEVYEQCLRCCRAFLDYVLESLSS